MRDWLYSEYLQLPAVQKPGGVLVEAMSGPLTQIINYYMEAVTAAKFLQLNKELLHCYG